MMLRPVPRPTGTDFVATPSAGWVQSGNEVMAPTEQCEVLDNIFPTAQGGRLRGGIAEIGDASAGVKRLFTYASGITETLFAATDGDIFDAEDIAGGTLRSTTSGDWSVAQIATAGGEFLVGVNGTDTGWTYDGATFSDISVSNAASTDLSQIWLFKERFFFVEENSMSAWYLPVESIGGALTEVSMGPVFKEGGSLLFGATWSLDSGSGLDDVCLFFSNRGEVAVYEGYDPGGISSWALVGVYKVGHPIDKHSFFKAGGDLAVVTEDGIIPISQALKVDRAALQTMAITYPIEDAWQDVISGSTATYPITATLWQSSTMLIVGTPTTYKGRNVSFVANARTGAWARYTGWDVRCSAVFEDKLYFANSAGKIYQADIGGTDDGVAYTGIWVPKFQTKADYGSVNSVGVTYRSAVESNVLLDAHADYSVDELSEPVPVTYEGAAVWGTGVWGTFVWGGEDTSTYNEWQAAYANGYAHTLSMSVTSNQTAKLPFEIIAGRMRIEKGSAL